MKKTTLMIIAVLFVMLAFTTPASADITDFLAIFTTDSYGSTTPKTSFGWNETPWLYVKLTSAALNVTSSWWLNPSLNPLASVIESGARDEFWLTPVDQYGNSIWDSIKALGTWTINAEAHFATIPMDKNTGSTIFTVTPEPVSSALFLIGGAALAGSKLYRSNRKRKA